MSELRGDASPECSSLRPDQRRHGGDGLSGHYRISAAAAADAVQAPEPAGAMSMASGSLSALGCAAGACVLAVFESMGYGGFLLGDDRQVLAYNGVAANALSASDLSACIQGGGLILQGDRVAAADDASDKRLQSAIDVALMGKGPAGAAAVAVRRDPRLPLLVLILRVDGVGSAAANPARLLLAACDPERNPMLPHHMLAEMFDLTPAEASIAAGIAAGRQLAEIAADRGVGIETVRWYSKIVFGKTKTRGQAELAALLTKLAMLAPGGK
jgi:DNA-binding CsgD family transcriptional regulator